VTPTPGQKDRYHGPDRREGEGLDASACRDQARVCFAQAIAAEDAAERERLRQRGEQWMSRARKWSPRGARPRG
jgi:hypothetical protein